MKNIKIKSLYFAPAAAAHQELPFSKTNIKLVILAFIFAAISVGINYQYQDLFAQIIQISKGLLQRSINFTDPAINTNGFRRPFDQAINRGEVKNYREVRTQSREQIDQDLKIDFPTKPLTYINKRKDVSPYTPPSTQTQTFILYKRLFTTLWNGGYSCQIERCDWRNQQAGEHEGVDIVMPLGTPVKSISNWVVVTVNREPSKYLGKYVVVVTKFKDQYFAVYYGHLSSISPELKVGKIIQKWTLIGKVGNTGNSFGAHLHLQINALGKSVSSSNLSQLLNRVRTSSEKDRIKKYTVDPLWLIQNNYSPSLQKQIEEVQQAIKQAQTQIPQEEVETEAEVDVDVETEGETEIETNKAETEVKNTPEPAKAATLQKEASKKVKKITQTQAETKAENENKTKAEVEIEVKADTETLPKTQTTLRLPQNPIAWKTYTVQLPNWGPYLLKIYTPDWGLQKIKNISTQLNYTFTKAGLYSFQLYDGRERLAKASVKVLPFEDYNQKKYLNQLSSLYNRGIVKGNNYKLYPDRTLSRAELVTVLMRSLYSWDVAQLTEQTKKYIQTNWRFFEDVSWDEWFAPRAFMAYQLWYVKGEDGKFLAQQPISRAQLVAIYWRVFDKSRQSQTKLWKDVDPQDWFYPYAVAARYESLLFHRSKEFKPNQSVTRLEAFITLYRYLNTQQKPLVFDISHLAVK